MGVKNLLIKKLKYQTKILLYLSTILSLLIFISIISLSEDSVFIYSKDIWMAIFKNGDQINQTFIWELRLLILLGSLLVGSSLVM